MAGESEVVVSPAAQGTPVDPTAHNAVVVEMINRHRTAEGITQKELAERLKITPRSLRNWMARASRLEAREAERLADALNMSGENRKNLHVLTGNVPPAPQATELRRTPEMALYQAMIDGTEHLSVVYTECWDIVIGNQAFRDIFAQVRPHATAHPFRNTTRYVMFHPDAYLILGAGDKTAFHEDWLMPTLAHFSATFQQLPEHQRLQDMEREIIQRPALRRAYRQAPAWIAENGDIAINPSPRRFLDTRVGRVMDAHIITEAHQGYQSLTLQRATFILRDRQATTENLTCQ
ncbi:helix-turn-helix domain-containing protein [Streptomyces sp. NBC_00885]|uniref:helix-turn-helix domain-containing protein n=1 Tax=Streptomyces sp. NBC_00885 TaxID=2975857 RepID=UPI00386EB3F3|nr:helix-turn-helix domain-containing protein [Streptomyces sp. NBC_00885]